MGKGSPSPEFPPTPARDSPNFWPARGWPRPGASSMACDRSAGPLFTGPRSPGVGGRIDHGILLGDHPKGCHTPEWPMQARRSSEGMQPSMRSTAPWVCCGPLRASGVQSSVPRRRPDMARHRWARARTAGGLGGKAMLRSPEVIQHLVSLAPGLWRAEFHGTAARSRLRSHDRAKRDTPRGSVMDTRQPE